ncbi:MAG: SsrA-binding protein SmpB [Candidatus Margulisbacteria bacterium]|nr:SsrA-binding protein SmpB [Candidatus Margulisiibacteriota bacterium]
MAKSDSTRVSSDKYFKVVADNRKARFDFIILEKYKAGLILEGFEVKSIRLGKVNLKESFGRVENEEVWIYGMHINPYKSADKGKIDPVRPRKVLLKKRELVKLIGKVAEKGLTLVPLKIFFDGNWAKVELGLAKAKKKYEKRETLRTREVKREIEKAFKGKTYGRTS